MNFVFQESSNQFELGKGQEKRIPYDPQGQLARTVGYLWANI